MGCDNFMHSLLRSLCLNTVWQYAVFWKLKHRSRMVLIWEDGYCDNCDSVENDCSSEMVENFPVGQNSHDPLGSALAKMSDHVYSLGEGVVGQVAVSGKHRWIITDEHATALLSSFEFSDGWQNQFSAGIRTVAVVAVVPHGVVQLGSLNKVPEDTTLVNHIKSIFSAFQESSVGFSSKPLQDGGKSTSHLTNLNGGVIPIDIVRDGLSNQARAQVNYGTNGQLQDKRYGFPNISLRPGIHHNLAVEAMKNKGESSVWELGGGVDYAASNIKSSEIMINNNDKLGALPQFLPDFHTYSHVISNLPVLSDSTFKDDEKFDFQAEPSCFESSNTSLNFPANCELHEALGPGFVKNSMDFEIEAVKVQAENNVLMLEEMGSSQMTFDNPSENLLEAVVAGVCYSGSDVNSDKSVSRSVQSHYNNTKQIDNFANHFALSKANARSSSYSVEACGTSRMSSEGFGSTCPSTCSDQLDRRSEPAKNNKRRARPGENCRPRPRDRQLIQDRLKELRELVPNGSKCSIDSLLERTIKHMLFLESVTKHAGKLNECAQSKMHQKGTKGVDHEQGSSWAVEVGGHLKVSSIIVENLNKSGQMLVELVCEECSHFLEIAEAIRSLGLTILKGVTEVQGDKTWICFIVEGHNNRIMHRMDILWPLVQILQPSPRS